MIILASNSYLRKLIFESSELPFEVIAKEVDERSIEDRHAGKPVEEIVKLLALAKAEVVSQDYPHRAIVAADTFGVLPSGERLHKTKSTEESIQLALKQAGQTVAVYTGVAIIYRGKKQKFGTRTDITYADFDEATARRLFVTQSTVRRHGALGFFTDAPGFTLVNKVEGSYLGAMGLPMDLVRVGLEEMGYIIDAN